MSFCFFKATGEERKRRRETEVVKEKKKNLVQYPGLEEEEQIEWRDERMKRKIGERRRKAEGKNKPKRGWLRKRKEEKTRGRREEEEEEEKERGVDEVPVEERQMCRDVKEGREDLDFSVRWKRQEEEKTKFVLDRKEEEQRQIERESEHDLLFSNR